MRKGIRTPRKVCDKCCCFSYNYASGMRDEETISNYDGRLRPLSGCHLEHAPPLHL